MSTLVEIENAVTELSGAVKEQLLRFTARALGAAHEKLQEPRDIPLE